MTFPHYGDECEHPRKERKDVGYAIVCQRCGSMKSLGEWRVRK